MGKPSSIEEIFFKYLSQFKFSAENLDYAILHKHTAALQILSTIGNSGISVFDMSTCQVVFYSSNFGALLGYEPSDYAQIGQQFFEDRIHPEDKLKLSHQGVSTIKIFNNFSKEDKLNHKVIQEYRMLNAQNKYVRLIEQYQILELDKSGQLWLLIGFVDFSPNQEVYDGIKCQLLNFRTGAIVPIAPSPKAHYELTKREKEILNLVREGLLSKEISNRLSISLHTVNTHRQRFLEKLGANNSVEAIMFASKFGLLD